MRTHVFATKMMKTALSILALALATGAAHAEGNMAWDKTFKLSDTVTHEKVSYPNRYGITLSADMYLPKNLDTSKKYPALVIGTPYGGVKEQGAGIYAQTMAERGFVAIAFDESFNGESGGAPIARLPYLMQLQRCEHDDCGVMREPLSKGRTP